MRNLDRYLSPTEEETHADRIDYFIRLCQVPESDRDDDWGAALNQITAALSFDPKHVRRLHDAIQVCPKLQRVVAEIPRADVAKQEAFRAMDESIALKQVAHARNEGVEAAIKDYRAKQTAASDSLANVQRLQKLELDLREQLVGSGQVIDHSVDPPVLRLKDAS